MLKPHSNPYGYKKLLAYKKAEELQTECRKLTALFLKTKTMMDLADQMDRSARSGKQNIVEGWKRNSTKEYNDFLGFSIGAIAELEEDCDDIWRRTYPELMGIKGVMGEKGIKGIKGEEATGEKGEKETFSSPSTHSTLSSPYSSLDIDKLKFYPLDPSLPPIVQLKLKCKELNYLLSQLQKSLEKKMANEGTMSSHDKMRIQDNEKKQEDSEYLKLLEDQDLQRTKEGKVIQK